jgi:hypothetical protein
MHKKYKYICIIYINIFIHIIPEGMSQMSCMYNGMHRYAYRRYHMYIMYTIRGVYASGSVEGAKISIRGVYVGTNWDRPGPPTPPQPPPPPPPSS